MAPARDGEARGSGRDGAVVVRRYPNRRMYDTERGRYVTLDEVADVVRAGRAVRVVDARGGADVTRDVLLQLVLAALERDAAPLLSTDALHRLVRAATLVPRPESRGALAYMLEMLLRAAEGRAAPAPVAWPPPRRHAAVAPPPPPPPPPPPERDPSPPPARALDDRVAALEARVAELASRLDALDPGPARRAPPR